MDSNIVYFTEKGIDLMKVFPELAELNKTMHYADTWYYTMLSKERMKPNMNLKIVYTTEAELARQRNAAEEQQVGDAGTTIQEWIVGIPENQRTMDFLSQGIVNAAVTLPESRRTAFVEQMTRFVFEHNLLYIPEELTVTLESGYVTPRSMEDDIGSGFATPMSMESMEPESPQSPQSSQPQESQSSQSPQPQESQSSQSSEPTIAQVLDRMNTQKIDRVVFRLIHTTPAKPNRSGVRMGTMKQMNMTRVLSLLSN
jgi:hypothetical protein